MADRPSVRARMAARERDAASQSEGVVENMETDIVAFEIAPVDSTLIHPARRSKSKSQNPPMKPIVSGITLDVNNRAGASEVKAISEATVGADATKKAKKPRRRALTAVEKGKGVVQGAVVNSQAGMPTPDISEQGSFRDLSTQQPDASKASSAAIFSTMLSPGDKFPPLDTLTKSQTYANMSYQGTKFISSVNKLALKYDRQAKKNAKRIELVTRTAEETQAKWEREVKEKEAAVATAESLRRTSNELLHSNSQKDTEIESLREQLASEKNSSDSRLKTATKRIVRSLASKFKAKFEKTKGKLKSLGVAVDKRCDLAQVDANLEFIKHLQSDKARALDIEAATISEWRREFIGGDKEYNALFMEMQNDLIVPYFVYDETADVFNVNPFDAQATGDKLNLPSGSNWDPSGKYPLPSEFVPHTDMELDGTEGFGGDGNNTDVVEEDGNEVEENMEDNAEVEENVRDDEDD